MSMIIPKTDKSHFLTQVLGALLGIEIRNERKYAFVEAIFRVPFFSAEVFCASFYRFLYEKLAAKKCIYTCSCSIRKQSYLAAASL
jgi:hypothetical protein